MHLYSKADNITACVKFITNFMQGPSTYENELFLKLRMESSIFVHLQ